MRQRTEDRGQRTEDRTQKPGKGPEVGAYGHTPLQHASRITHHGFFWASGVLIFAVCWLLFAGSPSAQNPPATAVKAAEKKAAAEVALPDRAVSLAEREDAVRKEEERLKLLKKELDEKIDRYTKLLAKMEETIKSIETVKDERLGHLIKAYESMPPEEAAVRLSALDEPTAVKIIARMKSKKVGAVMAAMDPKKSATLTEGMLSIAKKIPTK
ncbi:MAG: MotE family protein [Nitrospirales bacterium]|nr:MotE family protein [Nitrospirales bacterium]